MADKKLKLSHDRSLLEKQRLLSRLESLPMERELAKSEFEAKSEQFDSEESHMKERIEVLNKEIAKLKEDMAD